MKRIKRLLISSLAVVMLLGSTLTVSAAEVADIFDAKYYAEQNKDVTAVVGKSEKALLNHYIKYGMKEGRIPSERFDVVSYRNRYSDLNKKYGNDWAAYVKHYLNTGLAEGRDGGGMFDAVSYANRYPDLYKAFGYDPGLLYQHYKLFGEKEGRTATSQYLIDKWEAEKKAREAAEEEEKAAAEKENAEKKTYTEKETLEDGSYIIRSVVDGVLRSDIRYRANGSIMFEEVHDSSGNLTMTVDYYESGQVNIKTVWTYSESGSREEIVRYTESGQVDTKDIRTFNAAGLPIEERMYHNNGSVTRLVYTQDSLGRNVLCEQYDIDANGTESFTSSMIFQYIGQTDMVSVMTDKNNLGEIIYKCTYEYYASGQNKYELCTYPNGNKKWEREYYENSGEKSYIEYDQDGNITFEVYYDENGIEITP